MNQILENKKQEIIQICKDLKVKRMYAFGSITKNNFREDSDIDFLISFSESLSFEEYADNYFALHYKLKDVLGRKIDIVTERSLSNPFFIESINNSKILLYES